MVFLLTTNDMRGLLSMGEAVEAIESGFHQWAKDPQLGGLRRRVHAPSGVRTTLHQGAAPETGVTGISMHGDLLVIDPSGIQRMPTLGSPVRVVYDARTAELLAILVGEPYCKEFPDTHPIMGMPTAAASALGTKLLSRPESSEIGILGSETQARYHLAALCAIRPVKRVRVYSPTREHRERFAEETSEALGIQVVAVDEPRQAVADADIVMLMTNTNVPVLDGDWLAPGTHVTSVVWSNVGLVRRGQIPQKRRELDDATLRRAAVLATNSLEQIETDQGGDLYDTLQQGVFEREKLIDLGQLLRGEHPGRSSDDEITVFKNCAFWGMADQVLAAKLIERARVRGRGIEIDAPAACYREPDRYPPTVGG